jgi:two-component system sensor histidine kinase KdpD
MAESRPRSRRGITRIEGVTRPGPNPWWGYAGSALLVGSTLAVLKLFPRMTDASIALLLLLSVFLSAWLWESGPGVLAAVLATLGLNYFVLPPLHTFSIQDEQNVAALIVFLISGLLIGRLSAVGRERLRLVEAERADLASLTQLSQAFFSDTLRDSLLEVATERLRTALQAQRVSIRLAGAGGTLASGTGPFSDHRQDLAERAFRQGTAVALPSPLGGTDIYLPIPVGVQRAGVLIARGMRSSDRMAQGCAVLLGLSLERERLLRLELEAEETKVSDQMKSTLLAALAHDLKTPVAAARGAIENWADEAGPSEGSRLAVEELQTLTRRIGELMDVVRLDSGAARPRREIVTAAAIIEAALARFSDALSKNPLAVDVPVEELRVQVDPSQITEALGHGLENAARYSPPGSEIAVSAAASNGSVVLRVADRGPGIPWSDRKRVLERFVRLPAAAVLPGTGLGLSIARSLVELNGGRLRLAESAAGGTLFEIELPGAEA